MTEIFRIEMVDKTKLNIIVKGDKDAVIKMILHAMESSPEAAEAIMEAAVAYIQENRIPGLKIIR